LQLAAITLAIFGGMFTVSERLEDDLLRGDSEDVDVRSASKELRAAARVRGYSHSRSGHG
jgi:hypothetical protein